jgi:hypothetical protein
MLNPREILQALAAKEIDFVGFQQQQQNLTRYYLAQLQTLASQDYAQLYAQITALPTPGAIPTSELAQANPDWAILFTEHFAHHQAAQHWASQQLAGNPTFAVDGAQILPPTGILPPVAAIQIAQFENRHTITGHYRKQTHWEILTPSELRFDPYSEHQFSLQEVNLRRWRLELETLQHYMRTTASSPSYQANLSEYLPDVLSNNYPLTTAPIATLSSASVLPAVGQASTKTSPTTACEKTNFPPVVLLDGSLIISFAERWHQDQRQAFLDPLLQLLDTAAATRIPVVGYVGSSYACDLLVMLRKLASANGHLAPTAQTPAITDDQDLLASTTASEHLCDAYLFRHLTWGSRSIFLRCARAGILQDCGPHREGLGFLYLKTNQGLPARLEIPYWVYEQGLLDYVVNIVLSETVVGLGHPYALTAVQQAANISPTERATFYQLLQHFAAQQQSTLKLTPH